MSGEIELGSGLTLKIPLKGGFLGYWEGRRYKIKEGNRLREDLSETEGRIVVSLTARKACTPKQISADVGISTPSVLYNLNHLIQLGIVTRFPLPGGQVLYASNWEIRPQLSPPLEQKVADLARKRGGLGKLARLSIRQLRKEFGDLNEDEFKEIVSFLTTVEEPE